MNSRSREFGWPGEPDLDQSALQLLKLPQGAEINEPLQPEKLPSLLLDRFQEPLNFLPVFQSTVPGDSIVIAIAPGTTRGLEIAVATADLFVENGTDAGNISLLAVNSLDAREFQSDHYNIVHFDPDDMEQCAYLIAGIDARPIYVSRQLFDADVVIPVGSFYGASPRDSICPAFCDRTTQEYLSELRPNEADATINMVNENLGVFWQINALDAPGNELIDVLVGDRRSVLLKSVERSEELWSVEADANTPLVIATVDADSDQNWDNVAAALQCAERIASPDGAVAVVSRLATAPPAKWPAAGRFREQAGQLAEILEHRHIYLVSELKPVEVEKAGFAPVGHPDELLRLVQQYGTGTLIRDAHKTDLRVTTAARGVGIR